MEKGNNLSRNRDSWSRGNWKASRLLRTILAMVLTVATILGAVSGITFVSDLSEVRTWAMEHNVISVDGSFSQSQGFLNLMDSYLQLFNVYIDMQKVMLADGNLETSQKGKEGTFEDIPFFRDMGGNVLTLKQTSELGGHGYDYENYVRNYLNHFLQYSEEEISLKSLTEGIRSLDSMIFVNHGKIYYREGNEVVSGLTKKQRRALRQQAESLSDDRLYSGDETVLPPFESKEYDNTKTVSVKLQKTEPDVALSSLYQKWLFEKYPEYASWNMVYQMAEACLENFSGTAEDGTARSSYRQAVMEDYRKTYYTSLYLEDFNYNEIRSGDGKEYCVVHDYVSEEELQFEMDQEVYINNGKTAVKIRDLCKDPYRYYDNLNIKDGRVYSCSREEYARELLKKAESNRKKVSEAPWELMMAPCSVDMAADMAQFYLIFYKELGNFLRDSNFLYAMENSDIELVSNNDSWKKLLTEIKSGDIDNLQEDDKVLYAYYDDNGSVYYSNLFWAGYAQSGDLQEYLQQLGEGYQNISCAVGVDLRGINTMDVEDPLAVSYQTFQRDLKEYKARNASVRTEEIQLGICMLLMLVCFLGLAVMTGHRKERDGITLFAADKIWLEIILIIGFVSAGLFWNGVVNIFYRENGYNEYSAHDFLPDLVLPALAFSALALLICGLLLSLIRRSKAKMLFRTSVILNNLGRLKDLAGKSVQRGKAFGRQYRNLKGIVRYNITAVIYALLCLLLGIMWLDNADDGSVALTGVCLGGILLLISGGMLLQGLRNALADQKIREGAKRIADGDLSYQIAVPKKISREQRELVEVINHIGEGLENAVEESVRSERMKTELITNVSHDIKTPLTSVINYVDLLKREKLDNERAQEYLDILDQKSQRLKVLIEDLVEASKASSGAMELQITRLNFNELVHQTNGEFEEKFAAAGLTLVAEQKQENIIFRGDGRRVYRVLENLYGNVAKYAMAGTRVYIELSQRKDMETGKEYAEFSIKNISREPLNITPEELTERFVRGEKSRTTEGSGLGLSIAKNLTELMGGSFKIYLDGDLFRVTITFPV